MSKLKFFAAFLVLSTVFILSCSNVDDLDLPKPGSAASDPGSSSSTYSSSSHFVPTNSSAFVGAAIDNYNIYIAPLDNYDMLGILVSVDINPASGKTFDSVVVELDGVKINSDNGSGLESFRFEEPSYVIGKKYCDDGTHYLLLYAYIDGNLKPELYVFEPFVRNVSICNPYSSSSVLSSSSNLSSSSGSNLSSSSSSVNPSSGSNPNIQGDWDFERNIFIDQRDGKEYGFAISGSQVWMTENLNYSGSNTLGWCYGVDIDSPASHRDSTTCDNGYGRVYEYSVLQITGSGSRGICPQGWHIPTETELGNASALTRIYAGNYNLNETYPPLGWKERGESGFYWTSSGIEYFAFTNDVGISQAQSTASAQDKFSVRCLANAAQYCNGTSYTIGDKFCCGGTSIYDPSQHSCNGCSLEEKTYVLFEDFEGTSSNWSILSGSGTNRWIIGTSTYYVDGGSRSAYITSNGSSYGYSENSTSTSNLYTTVTFPSQTTNFTLSFNWKGMGESGSYDYDYMMVYLVPSSETVTSTAPSNTYRIGNTSYVGVSNWTQANITLLASTYSGKTYRLVFYWVNDSSYSDGPPAAIDNVRITN